MPVESLFPQLEKLLPQISKPIQYVGGELNSQVKDWDEAPEAEMVRWCLMYPDAYEVGLPNQGVMILYEVLNEQPRTLAERAYSVWPDLAAKMRDNGVPAFSIDAHRPIKAFDVLGISFSTELGYTNMVEALDLAGIPLHAKDRDHTHPIVLAGGHAAFNPEPIADFIDAAVLGDGEQAVLEMTEIIRNAKRDGLSREQTLLQLAKSGGIYVPRFYDVTYLDDGRIHRVAPNHPEVPWRVRKRTVMDLDEWPYPKKPLVPLAETVHERMSVEIFRGCTRGCRFCQAGMITRPVRERSITGIGEMVQQGLKATGYEEVGLLSLSSADHSEIADIAKGLADRYEGTQTSLSLPSTRVDAFNIDLAQELSRNGRRSGLTFAPEGGSERLRKVINKMVSKDDLVATVTAAYGAGWRQVKLYFMCGLPTETDEDVLEIADMARDVIRAGRQVTGTRDVKCTVSIGGFVPKAHTPFQWASQADPATIDRRLMLLKDAIKSDKSTAKAIGFRYHDGKPGQVEGLLSRGDRRIAKVIEEVWRQGGIFDGWSEHFSYDRWMTAAQTVGVDVDWYTTRERGELEVLPWDHLDSGLDKDWLWSDWQDALSEQDLDDCRWIPCFDCGVCPQMGTEIQIGPTGKKLPAPHHRVSKQPPGAPPPPPVQRIRLRYTKRGRLRFTSHRDIARVFERALRRAEVPMAYSAGFSPHPKVSWVGAAATGVASEAEYVEIALATHQDPEQLRQRLDESLPDGIDLVEAVEAAQGSSLPDLIQASRWSIELPGVMTNQLKPAVDAFLATESLEVQRMTKNGLRVFDTRAAVVSMHAEGGPDCAILAMVVQHVTPAVRPDDVLTGLRLVSDLATPEPPAATRLAQGPLTADGEVGDPFAPDRAAAETSTATPG